MPQITSYLGLVEYDVLKADESTHVKDYMSGVAGTNPSSNMSIIDKKALEHNNRITSVEIALAEIKTAVTISFEWQSTISETDYYIGISSELSKLDNKKLFIFYFDKTNTGNVTFKINNLDTLSLKKIDLNGELITLDTNDIKKNVPYFVQFINGQMVCIGENSTQELNKKMDKVVDSNNGNFAIFDGNGSLHDTEIKPSDFADGDGHGYAVEALKAKRSDISDNSVLFDSHPVEDFALKNDLDNKIDKISNAEDNNVPAISQQGEKLVDSGINVFDLISGIVNVTLIADNWIEDKESGYWTQLIDCSSTGIKDNMNLTISFGIRDLKQIISDGVTIMLENNNGVVTAYSFGKVPTTNLIMQVEFRQVTIK